MVDAVPSATVEDVEAALVGAVEGARASWRVAGLQTLSDLLKASQLMAERADDLGRTISMEEGKTFGGRQAEVMRAKETMSSPPKRQNASKENFFRSTELPAVR